MIKREYMQRILKNAVPAVEDVPHELTNIKVEEVSLVDRPANMRGFLVKKRHKAAKATKVKTSESATSVEDDADVIDLAATPLGELPGAELDRADAERIRAEKAAAEVAEAEEEKRLTSGVGTQKTEEPPPASERPTVETETPVLPSEALTPGPVVTPPPAASPAPAPTPAPVQTPVEEPPAPAPAPAPTPASAPGPAAPAVAESAEVAKIGRPMQRARFTRMRDAYKTVMDGLKAFETVMSELDREDTDKSDEAPVSPALPVLPAVTAAPVAEVTVKTEPSAAEVAALKRISELEKLVLGLQKMVTEQGTQLAKSREPVNSNAISLEKTKLDSDKVIWDQDLASPPARIRRSF